MRGSTFLATAVLAAVLLAAAAAPTGATGATLYVSGSTGVDTGICTTPGSPCRTIAYAVGQAGTAAATIDVTTGTYTSSGADVVSVGAGQDVTLLGGWEATFSSRVGGSTISGQGVRRAIAVGAGSLTLSRFTVANGSASDGGGLLVGPGGTVRVVESTFELNSSAGAGGAIAVEGGTVVLVNSTVATNHAGGDGAGVYVAGSGSVLRASSATIASNSAGGSGGGIAVAGTGNEAVFLADTLIGGNSGGQGGECATAGTASLTSLGYNAIGSTIGCAVARQTGDQFDVQLFLVPLGAYGGPTDTEPLEARSPLVDAGSPAGCRDDGNALLTTDQRGEPRPATAFDRCDIGAYELGVPANDDFANAQTLPSAGGQATGTNIHASIEPGEPEHAGDEGGASVWYAWTAPSTGDYEVDTSGSDFDTLLGIYEGPDVAHLFLPPVAQNDDASDTTSTSRACFGATAGHTYRIAVDGFGGDTGTIALRVQPKPDATPCPVRPPLVSPAAPHVGETVHAGGGVWVDEGAATHQWYRCQAEECDAIDGAVGMDYTVTSDDVGHDLRIDELENGSISTSDPTDAVGIATSTPATNGRIFWTSTRGDGLDYDVWSMLPDETSIQRLTNRAGPDTEPAPSPDGTEVVFQRSNEIAVMDSDGSNVRDLGVQGAFPRWSPDGSTIAYVGDGNVHLIDPDGSNDRVLASGASHDLAWSPDASQIAYTAQVAGHNDVVLVGADGRGLTDLTDTAGTDEFSPAWSPDGTQLLFVRGTPYTSGRIVVTDPADTSETTLTTPGGVIGATWSPDGSEILFTTFDNGNSDLYTIEPDGTGLTRLTSGGTREIASWGARVSYPLTVSVGGNGTVSSAPSGSTFADGTTVALTPSPAPGWTFAGWSGSCSGTGPCTVAMLGPRSVGATFAAVPSPPPSSGGGGGGGGSGGSSGIPPDIHVAVSASASSAPSVGADLLWFVTVSTKNTGGSSDVKLELTLPAGWTYDHSYADRGPGCVGTPPKLTCDVGFINGSASTNVQLFGKVAQAGDLALTATATSQQEPEFDPSDNTVTLTLKAPSPAPTPSPTPTPKPKPARAPKVTGSAVVGATVRAVAPAGSRYRWQLCTASGCRAIRGATKPTLKLVASYVHRSVRVAVTRAGTTTYSKKIPVRARAAAR